MAGGEESIPLYGMLAPLWLRSPQNPEDMLDWPADLVLQFQWYLEAARKISDPDESEFS